MTRKTPTFVFLLACLYCNFAGGQQIAFKTYTVEDGLVANPIRDIYQDSKGFIWIGTWEGLSKYDGHKFTNFSPSNGLSHNMINDIYELSNGQLLIAENNGDVDLLDKDRIKQQAVFQKINISKFFTTGKKIIVLTDAQGVYEMVSGRFTPVSTTNSNFSYDDFEAFNDSLFIGVSLWNGPRAAICILDRNFQLFDSISLNKQVGSGTVFKDSKNRVWVGTQEGLYLVAYVKSKNKQHQFKIIPAPFDIPFLKNTIVNDMMEDPHGNLWIATANGLLKILSNNSWQLFMRKDGLPSEQVSKIYMDNQKNIWIGTLKGLAKIVTTNDIFTFTTDDGLASNEIVHIAKAGKDSLLIIPSKGGFQLLYENKIIPSRSDHGSHYEYPYYKSRFPDTIKNMWHSTVSGDMSFLGGENGLIVRYKDYIFNEKNIPHVISCLLTDKQGFVWVGTVGHGLFRIRYIIKNNVPYPEFEDFSNLVPEKNIRSLFEDQGGNIWVGMRYKGVTQLIKTERNTYVPSHFDQSKGLMSNFVKAIAEDAFGNIWIGSQLGLDKLVKVESSFRVFNFSRVNGFYASIRNILPTDKNKLWVGSDHGLTHIRDYRLDTTRAPRLYISCIKLGDSTIMYPVVNAMGNALKYSENNCQFEFVTPSFINEKQILYSYRLLGGADTSWSMPSNQHTVFYASLQPGNYRFEVKSFGWNDISGKPQYFEFNIKSPYWQTWWFYSLILAAACSAIYLTYRYRINQLKKIQNVRNAIAADLHDDIGSTLTSISILSELSNTSLEKKHEAKPFIERIVEEVNTAGQSLEDIIWSVDTRIDTIDEMKARMRRYAQELFSTNNIQYHLRFDDFNSRKKLNMGQKRDCYLIYKELLNNIYKHAAARNVWVEINIQKKSIQMIVRDDGRGFDSNQATHRHGLKNLKLRVEKWHGDVTILSKPGVGSRFEISIPMRN